MKRLLFFLLPSVALASGYFGAGGSGGSPTGPAGGDLTGTYPDPTLAVDRVRIPGDTMTGGLGLNYSGVTANTVTYLNANRRFTSSPVTPTELSYISGITTALAPNLNGLTGNVQTQLNAKEPSQTKGAISSTTSQLTVTNGANSTVGPNVSLSVSTANLTTTGLLASSNFATFNGVTGKVNRSGDTMTGGLGVSGDINAGGYIKAGGVTSVQSNAGNTQGVEPVNVLQGVTVSTNVESSLQLQASKTATNFIKLFTNPGARQMGLWGNSNTGDDTFIIGYGSTPWFNLNMNSDGHANFLSVTDASSTTTGSVQLAGGLGVAKTIYGAAAAFTNTTDATALNTGVLRVLGGGAFSKTLWVDQMKFANASNNDLFYSGSNANSKAAAWNVNARSGGWNIPFLREYNSAGTTVLWELGQQGSSDTLSYAYIGSDNTTNTWVRFSSSAISLRKPVVTAPQAQVNVTADNQAVTVSSSFIRLNSDNATATNRTITLSNGVEDGALLTLLVQANAVELADGGNTDLAGTWQGDAGDTLTIIWDATSSLWRETGRSAN